MAFSCLIIGIEGTLCTTAHFHRQAWDTVMSNLHIAHGALQTPETYLSDEQKYLGHVLFEAGIELSPTEREMIVAEKDEAYRQLLAGLSADDVYPGVLKMLGQLKACSKTVAVVTANKHAILLLRKLGLSDCFDIVIDGNDLAHAGGYGEMYGKACEYARISTPQCLVWERDLRKLEAAGKKGFAVTQGSCESVLALMARP